MAGLWGPFCPCPAAAAVVVAPNTWEACREITYARGTGGSRQGRGGAVPPPLPFPSPRPALPELLDPLSRPLLCLHDDTSPPDSASARPERSSAQQSLHPLHVPFPSLVRTAPLRLDEAARMSLPCPSDRVVCNHAGVATITPLATHSPLRCCLAAAGPSGRCLQQVARTRRGLFHSSGQQPTRSRGGGQTNAVRKGRRG